MHSVYRLLAAVFKTNSASWKTCACLYYISTFRHGISYIADSTYSAFRKYECNCLHISCYCIFQKLNKNHISLFNLQWIGNNDEWKSFCKLFQNEKWVGMVSPCTNSTAWCSSDMVFGVLDKRFTFCLIKTDNIFLFFSQSFKYPSANCKWTILAFP